MTNARPLRALRDDIVAHRLELLGYAAILVLAAVLRLGNLAVRGTWDADQGHDMLVLRALVLDGRWPLLGPPTSIGDFHHGVLYYLLLAPAAVASRADPVALTTWIALAGIAAVAVTGWLARSIGGPIAGLIAALLLAVSASAGAESIFIWNPNLIALSSSVALAAAWHAWRGGRARWWVIAGGAAVVTMQFHVLGVILTPVIGGLMVDDVRRRRRRGDQEGAGAVLRAALGWIALAVLSYVPLAIHEIGSNASELRAAIAFLNGGGGPASVALPARLPIIGLRVVGWPLTGLITAAPAASIVAVAVTVSLALWRGWIWRGTPASSERLAVRWLALGLVWTVGALAVGAASLATVVDGLPNDHYHAFADPLVVVLVAVGLAGLLTRGSGVVPSGAVPPGRGGLGAMGAAAVLVALVGWNLANQPPGRAADGGWSAAQAAAIRVIAAGDGPLVLSSLPTFKSDEALRMPLLADGVEVAPAGVNGASFADPTTTRIILCDQLFRPAIGADCGGPAEDAWLANPASGLPLAAASQGVSTGPTLLDRFEAAPGRWISVYRP